MFNGNDKKGAFSTVDDVMIGLDDCGIFGVMESFDPSCLSWISLLLADEILFYEHLGAGFACNRQQ